MIGRAAVIATLILGTGLYCRHAGGEVAAARTPLASLPRQIDTWTARADTPLADDVQQVLGVDDYTNRVYVARDGTVASLYIGYYASQRQGDTIHSPQNCLPGAGWQPIEAARTTLDAEGRPVPVNRYVVAKGPDRQVVLYWYQGRGRIVANEYLNKFWLMIDAARLHRTNGSLVRVMVPVQPGRPAAAASAAAERFANALLPRLSPYLP